MSDLKKHQFEHQVAPDRDELYWFFTDAFRVDVNPKDAAKFSDEDNQTTLEEWFDLDYALDYASKHGAIVRIHNRYQRLIAGAIVAKQHPISWIDGNKAEIFILAVEPDFRRSGVGGELLRQVELAAHEFGAKQLVCNVHEKQRSIQDFYQKNGYRKMGMLDDYYENGSAVYFGKLLI